MPLSPALAQFAALDRAYQAQLAHGTVDPELADQYLEAAERVLRESPVVGAPGTIDARKLLATLRRESRQTITVHVAPPRVDPEAFEARDAALVGEAAELHRKAAQARVNATAGMVKLGIQAAGIAAGTRK